MNLQNTFKTASEFFTYRWTSQFKLASVIDSEYEDMTIAIAIVKRCQEEKDFSIFQNDFCEAVSKAKAHNEKSKIKVRREHWYRWNDPELMTRNIGNRAEKIIKSALDLIDVNKIVRDTFAGEMIKRSGRWMHYWIGKSLDIKDLVKRNLEQERYAEAAQLISSFLEVKLMPHQGTVLGMYVAIDEALAEICAVMNGSEKEERCRRELAKSENLIKALALRGCYEEIKSVMGGKWLEYCGDKESAEKALNSIFIYAAMARRNSTKHGPVFNDNIAIAELLHVLERKKLLEDCEAKKTKSCKVSAL